MTMKKIKATSEVKKNEDIFDFFFQKNIKIFSLMIFEFFYIGNVATKTIFHKIIKRGLIISKGTF